MFVWILLAYVLRHVTLQLAKCMVNRALISEWVRHVVPFSDILQKPLHRTCHRVRPNRLGHIVDSMAKSTRSLDTVTAVLGLMDVGHVNKAYVSAQEAQVRDQVVLHNGI